MTLYGVLLFLHILGAAVWLGGEIAMFGLRAMALRSGDRGRILALIRDTDRLNIFVISPAVAVVLAAGIALVLEGDWGFGRFFVVFGLAGFAVSSAFGGAVHLSQGKSTPEDRCPWRRRFGGGELADSPGSAGPARGRRPADRDPLRDGHQAELLSAAPRHHPPGGRFHEP